MKIDLEITQDQIDLLTKIKELPKMVSDHIGSLPQSFPGRGREIERIKENCEELEFKWKKWVMDTLIVNSNLSSLVKGIVIAKEGEYLCDEDCL